MEDSTERLIEIGALLRVQSAIAERKRKHEQLLQLIDGFRRENGCFGSPDESHSCTLSCQFSCMQGQPIYLCIESYKVHICDGTETHPLSEQGADGSVICSLSGIVLQTRTMAPGRNEVTHTGQERAFRQRGEFAYNDSADNSGLMPEHLSAEDDWMDRGSGERGASVAPVAKRRKKNKYPPLNLGPKIVAPEKKTSSVDSAGSYADFVHNQSQNAPRLSSGSGGTPAAAMEKAEAISQALLKQEESESSVAVSSTWNFANLAEENRQRQEALTRMIGWTKGVKRSANCTESPTTERTVPPRPSTKTLTVRREDMFSVAVTVLSKFFDFTSMSTLEKKKIEKAWDVCEELDLAYCKRQYKLNVYPLRRKRDDIVAQVFTRRPIIPAMHVDTRLIRQWASTISDIWAVLSESPYITESISQRVNKINFVFGCIFWMKAGLPDESAAGIYLIQQDPALARYFPEPPDFVHFGYAEAQITAGRNLVLAAINSYKDRMSSADLRDKLMGVER
jgi:hypothetical protein